MNYTGAVFGGDVVSQQNLEGICVVLEVIKDWFISNTFEFRTLEGLQNLMVFAQFFSVGTNQSLCQNKLLASKLGVTTHAYQRVVNLWVNSQSQIRRQGPWRGRPGQECGIGKLFWRITGNRESYGQGWVLAHLVGVIQAGFLIRQWSVLSPGIWQDAEALVDKALVIKSLKRPDDRFHVVRIHRLVAVLEIYPTSLAGNVFFPLIGVAQNRRSTVFIELLQTHIVDLALIGDSELLFCF